MQADDIVNFIRSSLSGPPPYASGTCPIPLEQFIVFYDVDGSNSRYVIIQEGTIFIRHFIRKINLAEATPEELGKLTDACQPATFGVNNEDVYDELYRKAGKMDYGKFSALLDVIDVGLIDVVRRELLEGENEAREIKVEMYKLNVYGSSLVRTPCYMFLNNRTQARIRFSNLTRILRAIRPCLVLLSSCFRRPTKVVNLFSIMITKNASLTLPKQYRRPANSLVLAM